jgi:hypothetical protein
MLGHLVFNRYEVGNETRSVALPHGHSGWLRRVLGALFRRR